MDQPERFFTREEGEAHVRALEIPESDMKAEVDCYLGIVERIRNEKRGFERRVYVETLEYILAEGNMRFSYCERDVFPEALALHREARKRWRPAGLMEIIEGILSTANYNGYTREVRRYPLISRGQYMREKVYRNGRSAKTVLPLALIDSHYAFGSHHFHVGGTIEAIVRAIEERYDLDFEELEKSRTRREA